jgi:hypothetical protein
MGGAKTGRCTYLKIGLAIPLAVQTGARTRGDEEGKYAGRGGRGVVNVCYLYRV